MVWACGKCSSNNNNSRTSCWKCDKEIKKTIKEAGTEKAQAAGIEETLAAGTKKIRVAKVQPSMRYGVDESELRIVLIGKTGVGKSSTANTILGQNVFKAKTSPVSVTEKCHFERNERFGKRILLVDTPGFFDTAIPKNVIDNEIKKCIGISAPGPHAFLLVMSFTNRFTEEESKVLEEVSQMFGDQMNKYLIVLFTARDQLDEGSIEEHVEAYPKEVRSLIQNAGGGCITFNNRGSDEEKEDDVKSLLTTINQMLKEQGGSHFKSNMFEAAEQVIQERIALELKAKHEELLQEVKDETRKAVEAELRAKCEAEKTRLEQIHKKDIEQYKILQQELAILQNNKDSSDEEDTSDREDNSDKKDSSDEEDTSNGEDNSDEEAVDEEVFLARRRDEERINIEKETETLRQIKEEMNKFLSSYSEI